MLKAIINNSINRFEEATQYDASYMKEILTYSIKLIILFQRFVKLNSFIAKTPVPLMNAAKIASVKTEDCGDCLQLNIHFAKQTGMNQELIKKIVSSPEELPEDIKLVHDFAIAVANNTENQDPLREQVQSQWGREVLIELSMAIATSRVYPALKRGMGYARSCKLLKFEY